MGLFAKKLFYERNFRLYVSSFKMLSIILFRYRCTIRMDMKLTLFSKSKWQSVETVPNEKLQNKNMKIIMKNRNLIFLCLIIPIAFLSSLRKLCHGMQSSVTLLKVQSSVQTIIRIRLRTSTQSWLTKKKGMHLRVLFEISCRFLSSTKYTCRKREVTWASTL